MAITVKIVNQFGDHACPNCGCMMIDPPDCDLRAGSTKCVICKKEYTVTKEIAEIANKNKSRYSKACKRTVKDIEKERGRK